MLQTRISSLYIPSLFISAAQVFPCIHQHHCNDFDSSYFAYLSVVTTITECYIILQAWVIPRTQKKLAVITEPWTRVIQHTQHLILVSILLSKNRTSPGLRPHIRHEKYTFPIDIKIRFSYRYFLQFLNKHYLFTTLRRCSAYYIINKVTLFINKLSNTHLIEI